MTDTIANAIVKANELGYYFNNLFQLQSGQWRCNLRSDTMIPSHTDYGTAADPVSAIAAAVEKMMEDKPRPLTLAGEADDLTIPEFLRQAPKPRSSTVIDDGPERDEDVEQEDDLIG